jgi:hypothetical protein
VATGILVDPYTGSTIAFQRSQGTGEAVQIDHLVPLAYAWDQGAYGWTEEERARFRERSGGAAGGVGAANDAKGDKPPGRWMQPNTAFDCVYATKFIVVLRAYSLPVDPGSVPVLRAA